MTARNASQRYALADDVMLQADGDEALLVKLNDEDMFALNATGAAIVQRLADGTPVDDVVDALASTYAADRTAVERDVTVLIADLLNRRLLVARHERG